MTRAVKKMRLTPPQDRDDDQTAAVRVIVGHAKLAAIKAVGVDDARISRELARQGKILLLAGLALMSEGGQ